mgnify:CR=1 FL=1
MTHPAVTAPPARPVPGAAPRSAAGRALWALAGVALLVVAIALDGWTWTVLAVAIAPDLPLLAGFGRDLAPGQLHPRAVPWYNAVHALPGPATLAVAGALVAATGHGTTPLVVGLVWAAHVSVDRACGFGLRTAQGLQR